MPWVCLRVAAVLVTWCGVDVGRRWTWYKPLHSLCFYFQNSYGDIITSGCLVLVPRSSLGRGKGRLSLVVRPR